MENLDKMKQDIDNLLIGRNYRINEIGNYIKNVTTSKKCLWVFKYDIITKVTVSLTKSMWLILAKDEDGPRILANRPYDNTTTQNIEAILDGLEA